MRWRPNYSGIALDIGATSVVLCQLALRREGVALHRWGVFEDPLRERVVTPAGGLPPVERAARLVRQTKLDGREAVLALKPPDATFHAATVPESLNGAPREQWLTMLRFEAARQAQCDPDAVEVDFWRLPPGNRSGANVMIAAVRREIVERWCNYVESLGLAVRTIDVTPCALVRAAWRAANSNGGPAALGCRDGQAKRPEPDSLWGVIDIGYSGSLLAVALGNSCVYARPLTISGDAFTLAIVDALEVDYGSAELLKRQFDPASRSKPKERVPENDGAPMAGPVSLGDLTPMLQTTLRARVRALAGEIERAFSYPMENYPDAVPSLLYVCGGGAKLRGLSEALEKLLGIDVAPLPTACGLLPQPSAADVAQPPSAVQRDAPSSDRDAKLAACVGLALRDVE